MKQLLDRPQLVFLILAPIVLISGTINKGDMVDIIMYDTILVLDIWYTSLYSTVFFLMIALNYSVLNYVKKKPVRMLTRFHIVLQILALLPFLYFFFTSNTERGVYESEQMMIVLILSFLLFLLATLLHFTNFIVSLLRKKR